MATALDNALPRGRRGRGRAKANPAGTGLLNPPGRSPMPPPPSLPAERSGGRGRRQGAGSVAINKSALPGPGGRQLAARIQAGAITQDQAQRTIQQRQTLAKALGPDWRSKLEVGGKSFAQVNKQLKANPGDATLAALRKKLLENRSAVLANARKKLKGNGEEGGE